MQARRTIVHWSVWTPLVMFTNLRSALSCVLLAAVMWIVPSANANPVVLFTDVLSGPTQGGPNNFGVPIAIFGTGFGAVRGGSRVTIGGIEVAAYLVWGANNAHNATLDMIVVQPGPLVTGGPIVVTVANNPSNPEHSFSPNAGTIFFISPSGSDANAGTQAAPFATILHAASNAVSDPGDTILVRGGVYSESEIWLREEFGDGGTAAQRKTIKNFPGEEPIFGNNARDFIIDASYLSVCGLNFRNGKSLGMYDRDPGQPFRDGERFINNTFTGVIAYDAIGTHGSHHLIAGNVVEVSGSSQGTQGHCFYISVGSDIRILHNIARGAPGYGIHIFDQFRGSATRPDYRRVISDVVVEGNILADSSQRSGLIIAMSDEGGYGNLIENVLVRNNIFTHNNHDGIVLVGIARNLRIFHNTFYQNGKQCIALAHNGLALDNVLIRNNLFLQSPNSICNTECGSPDVHVQIDPGVTNAVVGHNGYFPGAPMILGASDAAPVTGALYFANAPARDFRPLAGSVVIDAGVPLSDVTRDFLGTPRPQGIAPDLGAFERVPACDLIDFNNDGVSPDSADIADFLSVFGGGPCSTGTCNDIDFNNDGVSPDSDDIAALLLVFGGGAC